MFENGDHMILKLFNLQDITARLALLQRRFVRLERSRMKLVLAPVLLVSLVTPVINRYAKNPR